MFKPCNYSVHLKVHWWYSIHYFLLSLRYIGGAPPTPHMSWMTAQKGQTGAQRQMEAAYGHYRQAGNLYVTNI